MSLRDRIIVALLCSVIFCSGADLLIMTPILPQLVRELGVDVSLGSWWITIYAATTAGFALIFGPISDRFGRRPILIAGIAVLGLGTFACSRAGGFLGMLGARALAGTGAGLLVTSTTSYVGDHFDSRTRAEVMGWVMSGFFLSLILAMPLGAFLAGRLGWSRMFIVLSSVIFTVLVLLALVLPQPRHEQRSEHAGIASALNAYRTLLKERRVLGVLLMSAAIGMSMTMFSLYSSPWMEATYGLDTTARGMVYAVGGPAVLLSGPIAGRLSNRFGRVALILSASVVMACMQIAMPFSPLAGEAVDQSITTAGLHFSTFGRVMWPVAAPTLLLFFLVMMAGSSRSAPFQTLALEVVSPDQRGALSAIRNSFNQGGSGLGAALGGVLWSNSGHPYAAVCFVAAAATVAGVVLLARLVGRDRPS